MHREPEAKKIADSYSTDVLKRNKTLQLFEDSGPCKVLAEVRISGHVLQTYSFGFT